jgi:phasin family protein
MDDATIETKSAVEHTAAAGQHAYKETVAQAAHAGQAAFKDTMEKSLSAINEMNAQAKRNVEAVVASLTAATHGAEALSTQAMAFTKKSVEGQVEHTKALTSARSMQELIELQTSFAKSAFETYVAEITHAAETLSTAMKDSIRPLNERATTLAETLQSQR